MLTVVRDRPNASARLRLEGKAAPGAIKPSAKACTTMSRNWLCKDTPRTSKRRKRRRHIRALLLEEVAISDRPHGLPRPAASQ